MASDSQIKLPRELEAAIHKRLVPLLYKRDQGRVMGVIREEFSRFYTPEAVEAPKHELFDAQHEYECLLTFCNLNRYRVVEHGPEGQCYRSSVDEDGTINVGFFTCDQQRLLSFASAVGVRQSNRKYWSIVERQARGRVWAYEALSGRGLAGKFMARAVDAQIAELKRYENWHAVRGIKFARLDERVNDYIIKVLLRLVEPSQVQYSEFREFADP